MLKRAITVTTIVAAAFISTPNAEPLRAPHGPHLPICVTSQDEASGAVRLNVVFAMGQPLTLSAKSFPVACDATFVGILCGGEPGCDADTTTALTLAQNRDDVRWRAGLPPLGVSPTRIVGE
ncbi:hypothetical protein VQ042_21885 [Aurantimonas sp. A2-1-M11]|uniref:hypothetical protein n=1 Tax=Aurantimonas sp. A2-1-M11 TaxID=3113712 RepID=UPI002F93728C